MFIKYSLYINNIKYVFFHILKKKCKTFQIKFIFDIFLFILEIIKKLLIKQ